MNPTAVYVAATAVAFFLLGVLVRLPTLEARTQRGALTLSVQPRWESAFYQCVTRRDGLLAVVPR